MVTFVSCFASTCHTLGENCIGFYPYNELYPRYECLKWLIALILSVVSKRLVPNKSFLSVVYVLEFRFLIFSITSSICHPLPNLNKSFLICVLRQFHLLMRCPQGYYRPCSWRQRRGGCRCSGGRLLDK